MTVIEQVYSLSIGIVLFSNVKQLDFTAPYEVFAKGAVISAGRNTRTNLERSR
ncbi:hypothetical protein [Nostoc sp.]|uniref:hypothetical protein n=1 Tax=Nostoc sp. TaxID=1180 RepID=UPI002FF46262